MKKKDFKEFAFKGAKNPELLSELRLGKVVNPYFALEQMEQADFAFIIPEFDLNKMSYVELMYQMEDASKRGRWTDLQMRSLMKMLLKQVAHVSVSEKEYVIEKIIKIFRENPSIFSVKTNENYELWLQVENVFENVVNAWKERIQRMNENLLRVNSELQDYDTLTGVYKGRVNYLEEERYLRNELLTQLNKFEDMTGDTYSKSIKSLKDKLLSEEIDTESVVNWIDYGAKRDKPWSVFPWPKEKKEYKQYLDLVDSVKKTLLLISKQRSKLFGTDRVGNASAKIAELEQTIKQRSAEPRQEIQGRYQDLSEQKAHLDQMMEFLEEKIGEQKKSKTARMLRAIRGLKEKGVSLEEKSGVVFADEMAKVYVFDRIVKDTMEKMKKSPVNKDKNEYTIKRIAVRAAERETGLSEETVHNIRIAARYRNQTER